MSDETVQLECQTCYGIDTVPLTPEAAAAVVEYECDFCKEHADMTDQELFERRLEVVHRTYGFRLPEILRHMYRILKD